MTDVRCEITELHQNRPSGLSRLLEPVSDDYVHVETRSVYNAFELNAGMGGQNSISLQRRTFPTTIETIVCEYKELWRPVDQFEEQFRLANLQLQLFHHRGPNDALKEIVAFHWHPLIGVSGSTRRFENRPHLHLTITQGPIAKSHLAVTLTVASNDQDSVSYLDHLIDEAVGLVAIEVLDRLRTSASP